MLAFPSYQCVVDSTTSSSVFLQPNSPIYKIPSVNCCFLDEQNKNSNFNNFPQFYQNSESVQELSTVSLDPVSHNNTNNNNNNNNNISEAYLSSPSPSSTSPASSVSNKPQKFATPLMASKKRKSKHGSSMNYAQSKNVKEGDDDEEGKKERKRGNGIEKKRKEEKQWSEEAPTGYIHVRARRGQATDSHSLAERVRREKISERMKILQGLVPGCDKVTGKALMLDEIINYVQSLQNQVEFLSMKLASVSPMFYDYGMDMDTLMVRPDQEINIERVNNEMTLQVANMAQCIPTTTHNQIAVVSDANTVLTIPTPPNCNHQHFSLLDCPPPPPPFLPHPPHNTHLPFNQVNGQLLWGVEDQRQKFINQNGFTNSFH